MPSGDQDAFGLTIGEDETFASYVMLVEGPTGVLTQADVLRVAYLMLRLVAGPCSDVLAAAVGVFGMANVPFVYWSVNVWRTLHPKTTVVRSLAPEMRIPFYWCFAAFVCLYVALLLLRIRLEKSRTELEAVYAEIED